MYLSEKTLQECIEEVGLAGLLAYLSGACNNASMEVFLEGNPRSHVLKEISDDLIALANTVSRRLKNDQ